MQPGRGSSSDRERRLSPSLAPFNAVKCMASADAVAGRSRRHPEQGWRVAQFAIRPRDFIAEIGQHRRSPTPSAPGRHAELLLPRRVSRGSFGNADSWPRPQGKYSAAGSTSRTIGGSSRECLDAAAEQRNTAGQLHWGGWNEWPTAYSDDFRLRRRREFGQARSLTQRHPLWPTSDPGNRRHRQDV